jgi:hypothetical protein
MRSIDDDDKIIPVKPPMVNKNINPNLQKKIIFLLYFIP